MTYFSPASAERLVRREKAASTYDRIDTSSIDSVTVNRSVAAALSPAPITTASSRKTPAASTSSKANGRRLATLPSIARLQPAAEARRRQPHHGQQVADADPRGVEQGRRVKAQRDGQRRERQQRYPLARRQIVPRQHRLPAVGQRAQLHAPDGRQVVRRAQHQAQRGDDGRGPELAEAAQQRHQLAEEARQAG